MDFEKTAANLKKRGFSVTCFETKEQAAEYLLENIHNTTVGIGGSMTIEEMDIYDRLQETNEVLWHWKENTPHLKEMALEMANVYLTSANALAETGEIVNIDGNGNRVASTLFNRATVYFVVGRNKIVPDLDKAIWRARNIASPQNAKRLGRKTPCAVKGDRCYDCNSPERICRGMVIHLGPMTGIAKTEVILINEDIGF